MPADGADRTPVGDEFDHQVPVVLVAQWAARQRAAIDRFALAPEVVEHADRLAILVPCIEQVGVVERDVAEADARIATHPKRASTASPKTAVWRSTSNSVVAGDISAMLWNGVISTRRFIAHR